MELILPKAEIWEQGNTLDDIWAHIARCTRVCYQSTPKENGETDEEFVKRVILHSSTGEQDFEKLHGAMLEHGTVYLAVVSYKNMNHRNIREFYNYNSYSKVTILENSMEGVVTEFITTNLRVIYENNRLDDLKYICTPTEYHAKRVTVSFTTNIGVTREFNRHRVDSIAEESTRYCNYSKKNNGDLKIGLPAWLLDEEHLTYLVSHSFDTVVDYAKEIMDYSDDELLDKWCDMDFYLCAITFCNWCYNMLIKKGWIPQKAREVLPLATKSQLIHTAFVNDWDHFFKLRALGVSGKPHPNAELLAKPLCNEFIDCGYLEIPF